MGTMRAIHLIALGTCLLTACPERQVRSFNPAHDQEALSSAAQLFWHSLRWTDYEGASAVLEESGPRLDFLTAWSSTPPAQITDFQLVHIELTDGGENAERLEGLVVVKVEGISNGTYTVRTDMLRQVWYRSGESWYLDPGSLPFGE
jgi:hypothetical protein